MNTNVVKVSMRVFRLHLPQYLLTTLPVAITHHGETIGYYISTRHHACTLIAAPLLPEFPFSLRKRLLLFFQKIKTGLPIKRL